jgi:hypothetical protein
VNENVGLKKKSYMKWGKPDIEGSEKDLQSDFMLKEQFTDLGESKLRMTCHSCIRLIFAVSLQ